MVRVSTNRGTSTRNVKSGRSKSRRAKPSMRSGRGTISRSSTGSYKKPARRKVKLASNMADKITKHLEKKEQVIDDFF